MVPEHTVELCNRFSVLQNTTDDTLGDAQEVGSLTEVCDSTEKLQHTNIDRLMHSSHPNHSDTDTQVIHNVNNHMAFLTIDNKMPQQNDQVQGVLENSIPDYIWQQRLSCKYHSGPFTLTQPDGVYKFY